MSIAIYAVVKPSKALFALICATCLGTVGVAGAIAFGVVGELSAICRILLGSGCIFIAFSVLYQQARKRSEFHIHISGAGQIRFAELKSTRTGRKSNGPLFTKTETEARLSAATTIWPWLLVLRLQLDNQAVVTIPVLPDCMPADTFRALSVACRWLAAREHSLEY